MSNGFFAVMTLVSVAVAGSLLAWAIGAYRDREQRRYRRRMRATSWVRPLGGMTFSAMCGRIRAQLTPVDYPTSEHRGQIRGPGLWLVVIAPAPKGLAGCERLLRKPSLAPPPSSDGPISVATHTGHGLFDERFHCMEQGDVQLEQEACDALVSLNERYSLVSLSAWEDSVELRLKRSSLSADEGLAVLRAACDLAERLRDSALSHDRTSATCG